MIRRKDKVTVSEMTASEIIDKEQPKPLDVLEEVRFFPPEDAKSTFTLIRRKVVERNGAIREQELWQRSNFVTIVPINNKSEILFRIEDKYGILKPILTLPTVSIRPDELDRMAIVRALQTEVACIANSIQPLGNPAGYNDMPDKTINGMHTFFLAKDLTMLPESPDIGAKTIFLEVKEVIRAALWGISVKTDEFGDVYIVKPTDVACIMMAFYKRDIIRTY